MDKIRINIPSKLKNKLSEDKIYETFTYQVIKNVQQIFLESPFFFLNIQIMELIMKNVF